MYAKILISIVIWFFLGFISIILAHFKEYRNEKFQYIYIYIYDLDSEDIFLFIGGFISFIVTLIAFMSIISEENKPITKLVYKICNIDVKKNTKENKL